MLKSFVLNHNWSFCEKGILQMGGGECPPLNLHCLHIKFVSVFLCNTILQYDFEACIKD